MSTHAKSTGPHVGPRAPVGTDTAVSGERVVSRETRLDTDSDDARVARALAAQIARNAQFRIPPHNREAWRDCGENEFPVLISDGVNMVTYIVTIVRW